MSCRCRYNAGALPATLPSSLPNPPPSSLPHSSRGAAPAGAFSCLQGSAPRSSLLGWSARWAAGARNSPRGPPRSAPSQKNERRLRRRGRGGVATCAGRVSRTIQRRAMVMNSLATAASPQVGVPLPSAFAPRRGLDKGERQDTNDESSPHCCRRNRIDTDPRSRCSRPQHPQHQCQYARKHAQQQPASPRGLRQPGARCHEILGKASNDIRAMPGQDRPAHCQAKPLC